MVQITCVQTTEYNVGYWRTGSPGTRSGKNNYMTSQKTQERTRTR